VVKHLLPVVGAMRPPTPDVEFMWDAQSVQPLTDVPIAVEKRVGFPNSKNDPHLPKIAQDLWIVQI
jgi:hypothetical protein